MFSFLCSDLQIVVCPFVIFSFGHFVEKKYIAKRQKKKQKKPKQTKNKNKYKINKQN
jgi:hypothetical protein